MSKDVVDPDEFPEPRLPGGPAPDVTSDLAIRRAAVLEQKQFVTGRISETVRYIGFGILAIFYAVVSADGQFGQSIARDMQLELKLMAIFGVIAVLVDYLQYIFGDRAVERAILGEGEGQYRYDKKWFVYRARTACYWFKQLAALAGCILLLMILARATYQIPAKAPALGPVQAEAQNSLG